VHERLYKLRLSGDAQTFVIPSALSVTAGQDAQIISTATGDSALTFSSIVSLQNGATLCTEGSIRFNCLALYYFADPRMNAGQVTFGTGASVGCTGDATADLSGELPGTLQGHAAELPLPQHALLLPIDLSRLANLPRAKKDRRPGVACANAKLSPIAP
jgi:hypothetical protein